MGPVLRQIPRLPDSTEHSLGQLFAGFCEERGQSCVGLAVHTYITQHLFTDCKPGDLPDAQQVAHFALRTASNRARQVFADWGGLALVIRSAEMVVRCALGPSTDEVLGVRPSAVSPEARVPLRFLRRLEALAVLPKRDQEALLRTTNAFLELRSSKRRAA